VQHSLAQYRTEDIAYNVTLVMMHHHRHAVYT